jgi:transposase
VLCLVEVGFFKEGDYFIVDNASVHHGSDAFPTLCELLDSVGVHLVFLPKYSPELDPCEEVFSLVKGHLRCYRGSARFWQEILESLSTVTYQHIYKFYKHAIVM